MRSLWIVLVCVGVAACGDDANGGTADGGGGPIPTLQLGEACTESLTCISQLCLAVSETRAVCSKPCANASECPSGESWDCVVPSGEQAALCACTSNSATEICADGRDNDCDGVTDCAGDGMDGGTPPPRDSGTDSGPEADASTCPNGDCGEPEPTCETDPGLCTLCAVDIDCDDGVFCTQDICRAGGCVHIPRDNGCEDDEICDPRSAKGCVRATPCANDGDCTDDDACTISEYCDATNAICRMGFLDADRDEHLPTGCGGDDCNDADPRAYPGALDICDNRDNNCDGMIDPPSIALSCAEGRMCQVGVCVCELGLEQCGATCVEPESYQTDPRNCGACGNSCASGRRCAAGLCQDIDECAEIDDLCPEHSTCVNYDPGYSCPCDEGWSASGTGCVDSNECFNFTDNCDEEPRACVNTTGSFECECPDGYTGDGVGQEGCADIDECDDPTSCPGSNTACFNDAGTFECGCDDGFLPDAGGACGNYDECARGQDNCDQSPGECVDEVGGFDCQCPDTHIEVGDGAGTLGCASRVMALHSGVLGHAHCALLSGGRVQCWGGSANGQLGMGSTTSRGDSLSELVSATDLVNLGSARTAKAISVGASHTCAILDNDTVKCWGLGSSGQLGLGSTTTRGDNANEMGDALPIVDLGTGRTAKAIAVGALHTCAILDDNTLKCWGENGSGQLGRDSLTDVGTTAAQMGNNLAVVNLGAGRTAKQVAAGEAHTCAILDNDTVKCWGLNSSGQLGDGTAVSKGDSAGEMAALAPVSLGTGLTAKAIATGSSHSCVILNNNAVKCWGYNANGELGVNSVVTLGDGAAEMGDALPTAILGASRTAKAIYASTNLSCAILDNDTLKCWGRNQLGQLGQGSTASYGASAGSMESLSAVSLGAGRTVIGLGIGYGSVCALLDNERVKCWGENTVGQLGQGDVINRGDQAGEMGDALIYTRLGG